MKTSSRRTRTRSRARLWAPGATAGIAVAVLFLLAAPNALGASPPKAVVLSAPYKGTSTGYSNSWSATGCGTAKISTYPFFDPHNGLGGFSDRAASPVCKANPVAPSGSAGSWFDTLVPVHVSQKSVTVVVVATVDALVRAELSAGSCTSSSANYSCYLSSYAYMYSDVYLLDLTTGSVWYPSTYWPGVFDSAYNETFCYAGNCSSYSSPSMSTTVSATHAWSIHATALNPADRFAIEVYVSGDVYTELAAYGAVLHGADTSASVNLATMGNGFELDSITIV